MRLLLVAGLAALVLPASALAGFSFHPLAMGEHTYASWKAKEGQTDSNGNADQAFYLQNAAVKGTAASGVVQGIEGARASGFTGGLSYEHRRDSVCTPLSPRWAIFIQSKTREYLVNLGCATAPPRPGSEPGWIQRTWPGAVIRARIAAVGGLDALGGRIMRLALVLDRAVGAAWLDNITGRGAFGTFVWTFAGDNGSSPPSPFSATELLLLDVEPTSTELMTEEELLASLTEEDWAMISQETYEDTF